MWRSFLVEGFICAACLPVLADGPGPAVSGSQLLGALLAGVKPDDDPATALGEPLWISATGKVHSGDTAGFVEQSIRPAAAQDQLPADQLRSRAFANSEPHHRISAHGQVHIDDTEETGGRPEENGATQNRLPKDVQTDVLEISADEKGHNDSIEEPENTPIEPMHVAVEDRPHMAREHCSFQLEIAGIV